MKKSILFLLTCVSLLAALPDNTTTWELRSLGSATNAGCYITGSTGTDYSQQTAAQFSASNLQLNTSTTVLSVAGHLFDATDQGNCIRIISGTGFTPGVYEIVSTSLGVATLDRAAGTMGSTGGVWKEGGALPDPVAVGLLVTHGNTVFCKADGTYVVTAPIAFAVDNNGTNPLRIIGYTTTRGDLGQCSWTTATNSVDLITSGSGTARDIGFYNLSLSNTAATRGKGFTTPSRQDFNILFDNCIFDGFSSAIVGNSGVTDTITPLVVSNTEIKNSAGLAIDTSGQVYLTGDYIHDNAGGGVLLRQNTGGAWESVFIATIISTNTGNGIETTDNTGQNGRGLALFGVAVYNNSGDGLRINSSSQALPFQTFNSIYYKNGGFGINNTGGAVTASPSAYIARSNAFGANTSGAVSGLLSTGIGPVTLSVDPFISPTNFALNTTTGGGASLKTAGFPGVLNAGGTGHLNIGPLQSGPTPSSSIAVQ